MASPSAVGRGIRHHATLISLVAITSGCGVPVPTPTPGPIVFGPPESPQTTFPLDERRVVSWTASLSERVEETSVNLVISPSGTDTELFGHRQFITDPNSTTLRSEMPLGRFIRGPGVYVMRYISVEGQVLAEGEFELVADSS